MMIRGFGRNEHGSRRLEDFDMEDDMDETMVGAFYLLADTSAVPKVFLSAAA